VDKLTPVKVSSLTGITAIAAGNDHSLFLKNDGTVWAVGYNDYGQLGDGTTVNKYTPVQVSGLCVMFRASISSQTNVSCNGGNNGSATVTASGGTPPYSYSWSNGQTTATATGLSAGIYTVTVTDANGLSYTDQITITVNPLPNVTVSNNANTLTANQAGASYLWIDCNNNNAPISGETSQSFVPTISGVYAVIVTLNGCSGISPCQNILVSGVDTKLLSKLPFGIYPNPNKGAFTIQSTKGGIFELMDVTGKVINIYAITSTQQTVHENLPVGVYFVREKGSGNVRKLIIE
jgi:hypothetical protein